MKKTQNLMLSLYESNDKFNITANEDSLNHNMELIDSAITETNSRINSAASAGLKRVVISDFDVESDTINTPEFLNEADENTIYMVPNNLSDNNTTYTEYMVFKNIPYVSSSLEDYIYAKADGWVPGESEPPEFIWPLSSLYLKDATIEYVDGYDDGDGRPVHRTVKLSGYSPVSDSNEEHTITVSYWDTGSLWGQAMTVLYENTSDKFNIGYATVAFESVPEDHQMYSYGYNVRGRFSFEKVSMINKTEVIGSTDIDITNYYNKSETESLVDTAVNARITSRIDTTYNANSNNAQSGKAVASALKTINTNISSIKNTVNSLSSVKVSRSIVNELPDIESVGNRNIIFMVKNNSTGNNVYDEYMPIVSPAEPITFSNVPVEVILEAGTGNGIDYDANLSLENTPYTLEPSSETSLWLYCDNIDRIIILNTDNLPEDIVNTLNDIMSWSGKYIKYPTVSFSNYSNSQLGTLSFNVTTIAYEIIGSTAVDLTSKQDKFANISIQEGSNKYILNTDTGINWTTNQGFNVTNTTDAGGISLLNNDEYSGVQIGPVNSPYTFASYGIFKSNETPASRVHISNTDSELRSSYHGFIVTDSASGSLLYDSDYSNIIIDKTTEDIYLHSDKIIVGKSSLLTGSPPVLGTITNVATPVNGTDAVNKDYVDNNAVTKNSDIIDMSHMESTEINITVTGSSSPPAGSYIVDYFYDLGDNTYSCSIYNAAHQGGFGFTCNDPNFTELAIGSTIVLKRNFGQSGEEIIGIPTFVSSRVTNVLTPTADTDAANKSYVDSKAIFKDVGDGSAVTTTKTLIGFANGVILMGDNIDFNGSEIHLNKDGRTFIKGQSVSIEGDGGLTALSISNNKVQVWGSDVDTLEDIYIPIVGAATPTASSPADQVATKEYVDSVKDHILLKDTATDETYKISVTNGKLSMEVVE